ncbi:MAG: hypothetical protein V8S74_02730 [Lachnospirales bacterium]
MKSELILLVKIIGDTSLKNKNSITVVVNGLGLDGATNEAIN